MGEEPREDELAYELAMVDDGDGDVERDCGGFNAVVRGLSGEGRVGGVDAPVGVPGFYHEELQSQRY